MSRIKLYKTNEIKEATNNFIKLEEKLKKQMYTSVFLENTRFTNFRYKFSIIDDKGDLISIINKLVKSDIKINYENKLDEIWFKKNDVIGNLKCSNDLFTIKTVNKFIFTNKEIHIKKRNKKYLITLSESNVVDIENFRISKNILAKNNYFNTRLFKFKIMYTYNILSDKKQKNIFKKINNITNKLK